MELNVCTVYIQIFYFIFEIPSKAYILQVFRSYDENDFN